MALEKLTYGEFIDEVVKRLGTQGHEHSKAEVKCVLDAFQEEVLDCAANGYVVAIPKFVKFTPKFVAAKRKGELVRDPSSGEMKPRAEGKPAKFVLKANALPSTATSLPNPTSKQGKELKGLLGA